MSNKQFIFIAILALMGGVIGGALSSKFFRDSQVFAQVENKKRIIVAEEFRLVDKSNRVWAKLTTEDPSINLKGKPIDGACLVMYGALQDHNSGDVLPERVLDKDGKAIIDPKMNITLSTHSAPLVTLNNLTAGCRAWFYAPFYGPILDLLEKGGESSTFV